MYCNKCKRTGGCEHTDQQFPYVQSAETTRLEHSVKEYNTALKLCIEALESYTANTKDCWACDSELSANEANKRYHDKACIGMKALSVAQNLVK